MSSILKLLWNLYKRDGSSSFPDLEYVSKSTDTLEFLFVFELLYPFLHFNRLILMLCSVRLHKCSYIFMNADGASLVNSANLQMIVWSNLINKHFISLQTNNQQPDPLLDQRKKSCGYVMISGDFDGKIKVFINRTKPKHSSLPYTAIE